MHFVKVTSIAQCSVFSGKSSGGWIYINLFQKPKSQPETRSPSKRQQKQHLSNRLDPTFSEIPCLVGWDSLKPGIKNLPRIRRQAILLPRSPGPHHEGCPFCWPRIGSQPPVPGCGPVAQASGTVPNRGNKPSEGREFLKKPPEVHHLKRQVGGIHFDCLVFVDVFIQL